MSQDLGYDISQSIWNTFMQLTRQAGNKLGVAISEISKHFQSNAIHENVQWDFFREDSPKGTDPNAKTAWFSDDVKQKMLDEQQKMLDEGIIKTRIVDFIDVEDQITGHKLSNWNVLKFDKTQWDAFLKLKERAFGGKEIDAGEVRWNEPEKTDPKVKEAFESYLDDLNKFGEKEVEDKNKQAIDKIVAKGGDPTTYVKEKFKPYTASIIKVPGTSTYDIVVDGGAVKEMQKLCQRHAQNSDTLYEGLHGLDTDKVHDNITLVAKEEEVSRIVKDRHKIKERTPGRE